MKHFLLGVLTLSAMVLPAAAASVTRCADNPNVAQPANAAQPQEKYTRSFSNGAIRVTVMDTEEPACCSWHLMIQSPAGAGKKAAPACHIVSDSKTSGFSGVDFAKLTSSYDPRKGVLLTVPVRIYDMNKSDGSSKAGVARVRINSATGSAMVEK